MCADVADDQARYYAAWVSEVIKRGLDIVSGDLLAKVTDSTGIPRIMARLRGSDSKLELPGDIELAFPAASGTFARLEDITVGGGSESSAFSQIFTSVASVTCTHNFGFLPLVQVLDDSDAVFIPTSIVHNSVNDFTVTFAAPRSGTVMANYGGGSGSGGASGPNAFFLGR